MPESNSLNYETVLEYIRNYSLREPGPYDVNGVIHLMLAALDNLREVAIPVDLDQLGESVTEAQRQQLIAMGRFLETYVPEDDQ